MKKIVNKLKNCNNIKQEILLMIVFCFSFVFNFFIFGQVEILTKNQSELGVSNKEVLGFYILMAFLIFIVLLLVLFALLIYLKKVFNISITFMFGYLLFSYLQVLFFNGNRMNIIDGSKIYNASWFLVSINFIIFLAILLTPSIILINKKNKEILLKKVITIVMVVIFGMQVTGLVSTSASATKVGKDNKYYYFSVDEYLEVSKNDNIIVILMDRLGTNNSLRTFEKWEESKKIFNGFTFYTNNTSEFAATFPSVVQTLTGIEFDKEQSQTKFLPRAWSETKVFNALHEKNYKIYGLLDSYANYYDISEVKPYFDNIKEATSVKLQKDVVYSEMTNIAFMRNSPFLLKNVFRVRDYSNLMNRFVDISNNPGYFPKAASPETDLFYNNVMENNDIKNLIDENIFNFVHLNSSHSPYKFDSNLENISKLQSKEDKIYEQTYGSFKIIDKYLEKLKKEVYQGESIFKRSTIIVLADHGDKNTNPKLKGVQQNAFASLFIKPKGVDCNQDLIVDEKSQTSNSNFSSTVLELIGSNELKTKPSYFDVIKSNEDQKRYFYETTWKGWKGNFQSTTRYDGKYEIIGDAYNEKNWIWHSN